MGDKQWSYSFDGERYTGEYPTKKHAEKAAVEDKDNRGTVYIAQTEVLQLRFPVSAQEICERMMREFEADYEGTELIINKDEIEDLQTRLDKTFAKWKKEHGIGLDMHIPIEEEVMLTKEKSKKKKEGRDKQK